MATRIPDAVNYSPTRNFTLIPNELLRSPLISAKAKVIIGILLSNADGWTSYISSIQDMMKEGRDAVLNGIRELEEHGYVWRVSYVDKVSKQRRGSFWAYTAVSGKFELGDNLNWLDDNGLEIWKGSVNRLSLVKEPNTEKPDMAEPDMANPPLRILTDNNTNLEIIQSVSVGKDTTIPVQPVSTRTKKPVTPPTPIDLKSNETFLPLAEQLAAIIKTHKRITTPTTRLKQWATEIRLLVTQQKVNPARVKRVLEWYSTHVGGEYIPVVESGAALREKFVRLESAIERESHPAKTSYKPKTVSAHQANEKPAERQETQTFLKNLSSGTEQQPTNWRFKNALKNKAEHDAKLAAWAIEKAAIVERRLAQ